MKTAILNHPDVDRLIELALNEDGISNDLTTQAALGGQAELPRTRATIVAKHATVLAGYSLVDRILNAAGMQKAVKASALVAEGKHVKEGTPWLILEGDARDLLRIERTILNFLMRMCGIATETARMVEKVQGTRCRILHTRKTAPGHRRTDIYATLLGGAHPHRRSLDDAILVKENHLRVTSSFQALADGINKLRKKASFVEIEVTDFTELRHAMAIKPDRIMLDNFSAQDVERAVNLFGGSVELEASGGINATNIHEYAATGVDYVSVGWITHSAPSADLSMLFDFRA